MSGKESAVLIVEDSDTMRMLLESQLKILGFASESVTDGKQALETTQSKEYAAILMDVQMPVLNGIDTTIAIRDMERKQKRPRVPIIALTATQSNERCLQAGMDDFLLKPVLIDQLHQVLSKWIPPGIKNTSAA